MRLKKLILLLVTLLLLPGTALANPQEQFILNQVVVGHFDVWQHTNGTWQDTDKDGKADPYGQTGKRVTETYTYPQSQYANQFTPTRVEITKITQASNLTDEELKKAGRSETWRVFNENYLTKLPNNYSTAKTSEDIAQGTVTVQKTFDLMPKSLNLKDPTVRAELGMTEQDFSDMAQGWRWYTPVLIKWYGVPRVVNTVPDLSVKLAEEAFKDAKPGDKITSTVTYTLNAAHTRPETAWLRMHHMVGNGEYALSLEPIDPNDALDTNGHIEFKPGESKTYRFTFTVQDQPSKIVARINPISTDQDSDWTNNRDEAPVQMQNLRVQITNVTGEAYEGNPVTVSAVVNNDNNEMLITKLVWKVNGTVFKTIENFDIIKHQDINITFNMPNKDTVVTVEVNPDKNKPGNEINWKDNIDQRTITLLRMQKESEDNRLEVTITPERSFIPNWTTPINFTVKVRAYVPQPPPGAFCNPRTVTLKVNAQGQIARKYNHDTGEQDPFTHVIDDTKTFTASCGWTEKTYSYKIPSAGLYGQEQYIPITAVATMDDRTARDTEKIKVAAVPIPGYELQLTR